MLLEDKVIEIFCMSNDFYTYFDAMMEKHILKEPKKLNAQCSMRMNERSFDEKAFLWKSQKYFRIRKKIAEWASNFAFTTENKEIAG